MSNANTHRARLSFALLFGLVAASGCDVFTEAMPGRCHPSRPDCHDFTEPVPGKGDTAGDTDGDAQARARSDRALASSHDAIPCFPSSPAIR